MVPRHLRATGMSGSCWERPRGGGEVIPGKALASWKSYTDKPENSREQVKRSRAESWGGSEARLGLWVLGTHHWKRKPHGLTRQPQKETSSRGRRPCPPSAFPAPGSPPRALRGRTWACVPGSPRVQAASSSPGPGKRAGWVSGQLTRP